MVRDRGGGEAGDGGQLAGAARGFAEGGEDVETLFVGHGLQRILEAEHGKCLRARQQLDEQAGDERPRPVAALLNEQRVENDGHGGEVLEAGAHDILPVGQREVRRALEQRVQPAGVEGLLRASVPVVDERRGEGELFPVELLAAAEHGADLREAPLPVDTEVEHVPAVGGRNLALVEAGHQAHELLERELAHIALVAGREGGRVVIYERGELLAAKIMPHRQAHQGGGGGERLVGRAVVAPQHLLAQAEALDDVLLDLAQRREPLFAGRAAEAEAARVVLRGVPYVGPAGVAALPGAEGGVEDVGHFIERVRLLCQNVFFTSHLKAP